MHLNTFVQARRRQLLLAVGLIMASGMVRAASDFPSHPITLVVPFTAAGPTDSLARALAQGMHAELGVPIVVENKPGAGGNIGTLQTVRAPADGYTLLFGSSGPLNINAALYKDPGFDPIKDLTPIAYVGEIPNVLVVPSTLPVRSPTELLAYAKNQRGLSFGSSGSGSTNHLAGEMFNQTHGTGLIHVPYRGTAPALNDLLGGQITMMFLDVMTATPHIKSERLRALGVAASKRSHVLPDTPTFAEQGVASMDQGVAFGLVGPAGMPPEVVQRLAAAAAAAMKRKEMQELFANQGIEPSNIAAPDAYAALFRQQVQRWTDVVHATGAQVN